MSIIKHKFVPAYKGLCQKDLDLVTELIRNSKRLFVITGAGISTESGIPDYRSEGVGLYHRTNHKPMEHKDFIKSSSKRQLYWARNYASWPIFSSFMPNPTHRILADWEKMSKIHHHVTQNVDGLMKKSGSLRLTELHGTSYKVMCCNCDFKMTRDSMQKLIQKHNPGWNERSSDIAPDNDVRLSDDQVATFKVPDCPKCKKDMLKPDIVFFGDNIARPVVENVNVKLSESDALLVLGTSLQVYSAYRIVLRARDQKIPIGIINIGETRADKLADFRVSTLASDVIQKVSF